jgi:hypothetical protein
VLPEGPKSEGTGSSTLRVTRKGPVCVEHSGSVEGRRVNSTQEFEDPRPRGRATLSGEGGFAQEWYQSYHRIDLCGRRSTLVSESGIRHISTMPPRRRVEPPIANRAMEREIRELGARLDAMEIAQRRALDVGDVSDAENEEVEVDEVVAEDAAKERLLKVVVKLGARAKINVPMYEGNLDTEELLDWIRAMDKYFDYEDVKEEKKVRHAVTR